MSPSARSPENDATLVRAIASGDTSALAAVWDRYAALVHGLALRIVGDPHVAEEVVQDVHLGLWKRAATFDATRGTLAGYLLTLARSQAIDRLRHRRARPAAALAADPGPLAVALDLPGEFAGTEEARGLVRRALTELPAEERRVIELAYFEGLSQTEIAERTATPLGTVKGRTRNALRRLRGTLPKGLGGDGGSDSA